MNKKICISEKSTFHNKCSHCEKCCNSHKNVVISPIDLLRISIYTKISTKELIKNMCIRGTHHTDEFPLLAIRHKNNKCIYFTSNQTCLLKDSKPYLCSIFPLSKRLIMPNDKIYYYKTMIGNCGNDKKISSIEVVENFLCDRDNTLREASDRWHRAYYELCTYNGGFNNLIKDLNPMIRDALKETLIYILYESTEIAKHKSNEELLQIFDKKYKLAQLAISDAQLIQKHWNKINPKQKMIFKKIAISADKENKMNSELQVIISRYKEKYLCGGIQHELIAINEDDGQRKRNLIKAILKKFYSKH